ncbi:hypothetical protein P3T76_010998 [Phytophthora citrophthora]|uniref:Crinkler effector protein N-terminal domain-containing protein n=1 Tax=Phytophthora citrophthora TaxID=4793 RepID=A0AAD9GBB4_9STRA|nr:hypothetical protein P3T76_010998 [Phytophthora citrophthora]
MLTLMCAIVGVKGDAFSVEVDLTVKIYELKHVIKERKPDIITCDADLLKLFLAKKDKGRGSWLTKADVRKGVRRTGDYQRPFSGQSLQAIGLTSDQLGEVNDENAVGEQLLVYQLQLPL